LFSARRNRALPSGSVPPSFTAILISLIIFEKILERLASAAPFLRFMVDHLLCPDINNSFLMVYSSEEWGDKNKKMLLNLKIPVKKN
jgi:hypothetical protein